MIRQLSIVAFLVVSINVSVAAAQPASTLAGTNWVLREYAVQRAAPMPAVGEQRPTLAFGADGQVSGSTGCNSFSGPYTETSDQLTIGPAVSTLRACADDAVNRQEQVILQMLSGDPLAMTQQGSSLTLSAPAGMLTYMRAEVQNESPQSPQLPHTGGLTSTWGMLLLVPLVIGLGLGLRLRVRWLR